jgi:hypothetical protein
MSGIASPLLLTPPVIITSRFTSSGRCVATNVATNAPSLCPTRSAASSYQVFTAPSWTDCPSLTTRSVRHV